MNPAAATAAVSKRYSYAGAGIAGIGVKTSSGQNGIDVVQEEEVPEEGESSGKSAQQMPSPSIQETFSAIKREFAVKQRVSTPPSSPLSSSSFNAAASSSSPSAAESESISLTEARSVFESSAVARPEQEDIIEERRRPSSALPPPPPIAAAAPPSALPPALPSSAPFSEVSSTCSTSVSGSSVPQSPSSTMRGTDFLPPSINLGTWGDRKGSSSSASSSRGDGRGTPSLKERLRKYGDGYGNELDELRSIPEQVRASYGSKIEQPSSASSRYPKVIGAKPFKRPSLSQMTSAGSTGSTASSDDLSKSDIVTANKKSSSTKRPTAASIFAGRGAAEPDGDSVAHPPPPHSNGAPKPQFYFGEDVLNGHESNG